MAKNYPNSIKEYEYTGPLSEPIRNFVAEKRRIGYKFNEPARQLKQLDIFAESQNCPINCLPREIVHLWNEKQPTHSSKTHQERWSTIRQLGEYMVRHGYEAYVPLHLGTSVCEHGAFVPYIFNDCELQSFFREIDQLRNWNYSPYQHLFYPLLFRILYACGLRLSEALTVKIRDVDLENGIFTIRGAKFDKDRLVPMAESLISRCREYMEARHKSYTFDSLFFPAADGGVYSHGAVYYKYREALKNAGISYGGRGKGPRIHDFRHTFAVHCLRKWMRDGTYVENAMIYLSTYMGHANTTGTHIYLRLTAELFPDIIKKVEAFAGNVIPKLEVDDYENH
jgi:integrase